MDAENGLIKVIWGTWHSWQIIWHIFFAGRITIISHPHLITNHFGCVDVQDLERFLGRRAVTELRRRELLHKRWTERVWLPIQRRVEDFSRLCVHEGDRMRCLNADYIRHCNAKVALYATAELTSYDWQRFIRQEDTFSRRKQLHCCFILHSGSLLGVWFSDRAAN